MRNPITGILTCSARAPSAPATAAPPRSVMKSRLRITSSKTWGPTPTMSAMRCLHHGFAAGEMGFNVHGRSSNSSRRMSEAGSKAEIRGDQRTSALAPKACISFFEYRPWSARCLPGKSVVWLSSPACKNILLFDLPKSTLQLPPSRPTQRGVSRSSRTLGTGCDGR